jgi:hypothetical protein
MKPIRPSPAIIILTVSDSGTAATVCNDWYERVPVSESLKNPAAPVFVNDADGLFSSAIESL